MRISSIELQDCKGDTESFTKKYYGLKPFNRISLGNIVVLAGRNGSGKTRLLKLIEQYVRDLHNGVEPSELKLYMAELSEDDKGELLTPQNVSKIELVNYSHYDAKLQSPKRFTPYVISKAWSLLKKTDYEETALNALLLLEDMSNGYSPEFKDGSEWERFARDYAAPFAIELSRAPGGKPNLFERDVENAGLSPGQQYLLRMAVACYRNDQNDRAIFFLDEPELHLHPSAQIKLVETLRSKFINAQFWISTHSLALISFLTTYDKSTTVLFMSKGEIKLPRSDSSDLLSGLIGNEDNRFAIRQLLAAPDEYACNRFAAECLTKPLVSDTLNNNPQNDLLRGVFSKGSVIVDFGVGKCRFLEELAQTVTIDTISRSRYFAYDKYETYAAEAKLSMDTFGSTSENYFNDKVALRDKVGSSADYVLMVNVLHEIDPKMWKDEFDFIGDLLKDTGKLVIVEREELTIGESPYTNGFLMMTREGAKVLFGANNCSYRTHSEKPYIVGHTVAKPGLAITAELVRECVTQINKDARDTIREIKNTPASTDREKFKNGVRLAFFLNQFANSSLICDGLDDD